MSDPRIWGWDTWKFLHRSGLAYPEKPTDEDKQKARNFFEALPVLLPCPSCAMHYKAHFEKTFNDATLESSETLSRWIYDLHETVNKRFGVDSNIKFEDVRAVVNKFPSRYIDLDTGYILQTARYADEYGVSAPADKEARDWLEAHPGMALDDRSALEQIFAPIGEKQCNFSRLVAFATLLLTALALLVISVYFYYERKRFIAERVTTSTTSTSTDSDTAINRVTKQQ